MNTSAFNPAGAATIVDVLRYRATHQPDQLAYTFLEDGEAISGQLTYSELDRMARAVAATLQRRTRPGDRVLLTYPQGLDFVVSFFGCLYSGLIAIPAPLPERGRLRRTLDRLRTIADDADAAFILTTTSSLPFFNELATAEGATQFAERLATDAFELAGATEYLQFEPQADALAYLQYTSGSTTYPRGVMVGHRNLIVNSAAISRASPYGADCRTVTWLPYFHDYGLVEGLLQPLFSGFPCWFFSPLAFVERPLRWLSAVSRFRATHSQAPSFAFAMAVAKIAPSECRELELSSWRVAGNGSEPINADTAIRFVEAFSQHGFRREAFCPEYGLAEATLIVSYKRGGHLAVVRPFDVKALEQHHVLPTADGAPNSKRIASCGQLLDNVRVEIVDPQTARVMPPQTVGEIWVAAPSVTPGYWQRPDDTDAVFAGRLADTGEGPFLRTGDLGFLLDGELYVTGRVKDLIIVHGVNHYPQDIEETVECAHPSIRPGCSSAFAIEIDGEERLVVMAESKATGEEVAELEATVRELIALNHGLALYRLVLIAPGALPKTSSGKKQRSAARKDYLERHPSSGNDAPTNVRPSSAQNFVAPSSAAVGVPATAPLSAAPIEAWLRSWLAARGGLPVEAIDPRQSFARFGLVSIDAIELAAQLKEWLGRPVTPTAIYECVTPEQLAATLAGAPLQPAAGWQVSGEVIGNPAPSTSSVTMSPCATGDEAYQAASLPTAAARRTNDEPIAIVGMACRLPGANTPDEYWRNLLRGVTSIREIPRDRWSVADFYDPRPLQPGKSISKWGGFLERVDRFDARFFGFSPFEAERMDPQQRLVLELSWEAFEHAGLISAALAGSSTGVFVGVSVNEYAGRVFSQLQSLGGQAASGNYLAVVANRVSHFLGLRGPSLAIDTACSSSLVAVHLAVQSLRQQECSTALAGGVQILLEPDVFIDCSQAGMLAPDGVCKSFDDRANGFVRGEGASLLVLKRLSDAIRDGHTIHAVIKATAVNQDGHTNGLTAPNGAAQADLLRRAYQAAGVSPESIGYIEAHGTGTALGDPIEVEALTEVFSTSRRSQYCALGAVKPNIGHLEPAAGAAGLLKAALAIAHGQLPPTLNLTTPNRLLSLENSPFYLLDRTRSWTSTSGPRRAGVSSFGFGGTNAHVVLEQAPRLNLGERETEPQEKLFVLSARSESALQELVDRFLKADIPDGTLADVCYTLQVGRAHFSHRLAVEARTVAELKGKLSVVSNHSASPDAAADGVYRTSTCGADGAQRAIAVSSFAQASPSAHDSSAQTRLLAEHYVSGHDVDWSVLHAGQVRRRVPAPTYPFERQRFWLDDKRTDRRTALDQPAAMVIDDADTASRRAVLPPTAIERLLQHSVADVLGLPVAEVGLTINIQELGLNSILATKAAAVVSRQSGVELEAIEFYLQPTLGRLAAHLALQPDWQSPRADTGDATPTGSTFDRTSAARTARQKPEQPGHTEECPQRIKVPEITASSISRTRSRDIAVIGIACRFPGADSPEAFWKNLLAGRDVVGPLPSGRRCDAGLADAADTDLPFGWRQGGFLEDVAGFDAGLFGVSPHEARRMDPQQRLFLECAWQTLERAGYAPTRLADRRVGVFAGVAPSDYARLWDRLGGNDDPHFGSGTSLAMVANRASYLLNLVGPSISIDTACSGSLMAVTLACQSLRAGECKMALAGGVNLILVPELSGALARGGMLSPRGRSCSFDDRADGYVRSEGVGMVLLKPLEQALADGDQLFAVIKGIAVNHDGHDKPGLTAPNVEAQVELLRSAYADAGIDPRSVTYLEAHGTGTALGDPIELTALQAVCGAGRPPGDCALGAVKSSVGHLEAAAGIAGLIKTVLALHRRTLPPSLHCEAPNRRFDWPHAAFYLLDRPRDWIAQRRRAGVSSFGFGGANAHVVLEEAPIALRSCAASAAQTLRSTARTSLAQLTAQSPAAVLVLSAQTEMALRRLVESYLDFLNQPGGPALRDLCFTTNSGRAPLHCRLAIVARYRDQLADRLRALRNWDERNHLQGSLVLCGTPPRFDQEPDAQIQGMAEAWHARCASTTSEVLDALQQCVSGSLWNAHLKRVVDEQLSATQIDRRANPDPNEDASIPFWCALGQLFVWGVEINWERIYAGSSYRRVLVPTYPFERQRYWLEPVPNTVALDTRLEQEEPQAHATDARDPAVQTESHDPNALARIAKSNYDQDELTTQLIELLANALEADPSSIDPRRPVVELGVDSILAVGVSRRLSVALGRTVSPTIVFEAGSIVGLADRLRSQHPDATELIAASRRSNSVAISPLKAPTAGTPPRVSEGRTAQPSTSTAPGRSASGTRRDNAEPIAIVGVGVRVSGASTLNELWSLIRSGCDLVAPVSSTRWELLASNGDELRDASSAGDYAAALLSDVDWFDPQFFRLSPREAEEMDPQQRLLLETAWEALESAGYAGGALAGTSTGVFVGGMASEYLPRLLATPERVGAYAVTGNTLSILANRLSYLLNLRGPCVALDTACSSSLVALRLAIESLRRGDCDTALVAGAQVGLAPMHFRLMHRFGGLSPRGRCRPFAQGADGYALGEGVGVVLLKPLDRAVTDRDHVLAVIRGAAINHGGQAAGLTVPNPAAQAEVIRAALSDGELAAESVSLVEAHGTGTALGDPLEVQGLLEAFRSTTAKSQFCAIGSIKANIGHLEPAAGILGLIKLIAALNARELPPSLHLDEPNRSISFEGTPFYVVDRARPWNSPAGSPRRAGLSSFGYGGANAHVVVEEAPISPAAVSASHAPEPTTNLLMLSARSSAALTRLAERFTRHLETSQQRWLDICWTAAVGRPHWPIRLAVVADDPRAAARQLQAYCQLGATEPGDVAGESRSVATGMHVVPAELSATTRRRSSLHQALRAMTPDQRSAFARFCPTFDAKSVWERAKNDEAATATMASIMRDSRAWRSLCGALAEAYSLGHDLHWASIFALAAPERVPLPTYPFERQRLWRDLSAKSAAVPVRAVEQRLCVEPENSEELESQLLPWLREVQWRTAPLGARRSLAAGFWLVLDDETVLGSELARRLQATGSRVLRVRPRTGIVNCEVVRRSSTEAFVEIDPRSRESYDRLLQTVARENHEPLAGVIHLWSQHRTVDASRAPLAQTVADTTSVAWQLTVNSSLRLIQAMAAADVLPAGGTWFVTREAQTLDSTHRADPVSAALWGLVRAAERERGDLQLRLRDLPSTSELSDVLNILDDLSDGSPFFEAAWRDNVWLVPGMSPYIPTTKDWTEAAPLDPSFVYLISGGLGAVGLTVAESFVERGARRLVLLSRRGSNGASERAPAAAVARMRGKGATVWTPSVDVCDRESIERLVADVRDRLGPVHGVVHAAGVLADRLLPNVEPGDFERVLAPKLIGAANLLSTTANESLDFFVVVSSLASHVGNTGQIAYTAASSCLDAWLEQVRSQYASIPICVVDLGPWGESGMAARAATGATRILNSQARDSEPHAGCQSTVLEFWRQRGLEPIPPRIGCRAIAVAVNEKLPRLAVFSERLDADSDARKYESDFRQLSDIARTANRALLPMTTPLQAPQVGEPRDATVVQHWLEQVIAAAVADALRLPPTQIVYEREYREHGLDSLMADETVRRLRQTLQLPELRVGDLFAHPSVERLASWLASEFGARLGSLYSHQSARLRHAADESTFIRSTGPISTTRDDGENRHDLLAMRRAKRSPSRVRVDRDIAVIGFACNFPGANDAAAFGELIRAGRSVVAPMPADRWKTACRFDSHYAAAFGHEPPLGGFLTDIDRFDPEFFRISPTEAAQIDPRQRLFLEVAYHAAEHAGYGGNALRGARCGVFVGTGGEDYYAGVAGSLLNEHAAPGGTAAALPGRLAYFLDLRGPALAIDTACSSSLVALHQAVGSLRRRECQYAFVGGVHMHMRLYSYLSLRRMGALSSSGVCRPFDRRADGFVPGEGVAVLLIRPLADALAAGDTVYGVIRGSAVNNDGRSNGMLAPNPQAQVELLRAAWNDSEVDPATISYFEAHGTGTPLGDPMEWSAIDEALRSVSARRQFAGVGAVKSNIGHADAAAGLAGVIKVLLGFARHELDATCGLTEPNPRFEVERSPLMLIDRVRPWRPRTLEGKLLPCRAGVSSFGFAGTNAHVVLEEPPATTQRAIQAGEHVLTLSALDQAALRKLAGEYAQYLQQNPRLELLDVCHTANTGRAHLPERLAVVAATLGDCAMALEGVATDVVAPKKITSPIQARSSPTLCIAGNDSVTAAHHRRVLDGLLAEINERELRQLRSACRGTIVDDVLPRHLPNRPLQAQTSVTTADSECDSEGVVRRVAALLYVLGAAVDWSQLENYHAARRVALPPYPYRDERYWLSLPPAEPIKAVNIVLPAARPTSSTSDFASQSVDALFSVPVWKRCDLADSDDDMLAGRWLIAGTRSELAGQLVKQMLASGCDVVDLTSDEHDIDIAEGTQATNGVNGKGGYHVALTRCAGDGARLTGIVHLSATDRNASRESRTSSVDRLAEPARQALDLVRLVQAVQSGDPPAAIQLWVVTAGAQAVTSGSDCVSPADAALWGLARVIPRECPQLRTRAVDVAANEARCQPAIVAAELVREFSRRTTAAETAYRKSNRYVLTRQQPADRSLAPRASIRRRGTYLITGGLGGIGLTLAHWLAENYQARLVLLSRTPMPPRRTWTTLLADDRTDSRLRVKLQSLIQIEATGSELIVVSGDVADAAILRRAEHLARTQFEGINGLFHAAGTVQKRSLRNITTASWNYALRAKFGGGQALIEWARREKFDFVLFFSSIAGIDGNVFQAEYSAVNRALDALAASARADGLPVQSVAWDLWRGIGMGRDMADLANERGQLGLDPQLALVALERALTLECAEIIVRAPAWNVGDAMANAKSDKSNLSEVQVDPHGSHRGQSSDGRDAGDGAPQSKVELGVRLRRALREAVADTLGLPIERLNAQQSLPDLGLDSLLAVRLMRRLSQVTGQTLSATLPFDFASLELLAEHLESSLSGAAIAAWLGPMSQAPQLPVNGQRQEPPDERVLNLQSGRRIKLLASRGLAWPG
jgi:acyl transferase domain-containing protein/acyl-CoA synthetase (AMP-forming)/AMP-acid ligase II/aryl carrier-like protein